MENKSVEQIFKEDGFMDNALKQRTIEMLGGWDTFAAMAPKQSRLVLEERMLDIELKDLPVLMIYFAGHIKSISVFLMDTAKAAGHKSPEYYLAKRVPAIREAGITADDVIEILTKRKPPEKMHLVLQIIYQLVAKKLFDHYTFKYSNTVC